MATGSSEGAEHQLEPQYPEAVQQEIANARNGENWYHLYIPLENVFQDIFGQNVGCASDNFNVDSIPDTLKEQIVDKEVLDHMNACVILGYTAQMERERVNVSGILTQTEDTLDNFLAGLDAATAAAVEQNLSDRQAIQTLIDMQNVWQRGSNTYNMEILRRYVNMEFLNLIPAVDANRVWGKRQKVMQGEGDDLDAHQRFYTPGIPRTDLGPRVWYPLYGQVYALNTAIRPGTNIGNLDQYSLGGEKFFTRSQSAFYLRYAGSWYRLPGGYITNMTVEEIHGDGFEMAKSALAMMAKQTVRTSFYLYAQFRNDVMLQNGIIGVENSPNFRFATLQQFPATGSHKWQQYIKENPKGKFINFPTMLFLPADQAILSALGQGETTYEICAGTFYPCEEDFNAGELPISLWRNEGYNFIQYLPQIDEFKIKKESGGNIKEDDLFYELTMCPFYVGQSWFCPMTKQSLPETEPKYIKLPAGFIILGQTMGYGEDGKTIVRANIPRHYFWHYNDLQQLYMRAGTPGTTTINFETVRFLFDPFRNEYKLPSNSPVTEYQIRPIANGNPVFPWPSQLS